MKKQLTKYNRIITIILLIGLFASAYFVFWGKTEMAVASWWNDSWSYRKALTINSNQVAGDLTDFPVLVSLTDTNLINHAQEDGDDFIFIDREGKKLSHEIESYASSTGVLVAWVKIPNLSSTDDTDIFMYYGNLSVSSSAEPAEVWDDNFVMVQHLNESSGTRIDASKYGNDLSDNNTVTSSSTGKIGTAADFESSNVEYLERTNDDLSSNFPGKIDSNYTMSAWVKFESNTSGHSHYLFAKSSNRIFVYHGGSTGLFQHYMLADGATADTAITSTSSWNYVVLVRSGLSAQFFINGVADGSSGLSVTPVDADEFLLGTRYDKIRTDRSLDGLLDEARVSNVMRSANWIQTEYNNQNNPSAFFAVQAEEVGPGPVGYWSFDDPSAGSGQESGVHDESGQGNHGTNYGATQVDESMCVSGKCLWFDGVDQTNITTDVQDNMNEFTACTWLKANSFINEDSDTDVYLLYKNWNLSLDNNGQPSFVVGTNGVHARVDSADNLELNEWYYLCGVYRGVGNNHQIFINAVDKSGLLFEGNGAQNDDSSYDLNIGVSSNVYAGNFDGYMDEVKIYPYARTADQIKQDYNAGLSGVSSQKGSAVSFGGLSDKWMSDGLVGYWKFDETVTTSGAIDSSGNGNDGTYVGNASTTGGKFGNGFVGDGDGDYSLLGDVGTGNLSAMTISVWVNLSDTVSGVERIVSYRDSDSTNNWYIEWASTERFGFFLNADSNVEADSNNVFNNNIGTWYHLVGVYDGTNVLLYIDGILQDDQPINSGNIQNGSGGNVCVGCLNTVNEFDGKIDEVRIYNRALSDAEVQRLYEWAPGPVLHLKMDEMSGWIAYDSSGYENNGGLGGDGVGTDLPSWVRGKYGSALDFDGIDDDVLAYNSTSTKIGTSDMSISSWIKIDSLSGDRTIILNGATSPTGDSGFNFTYDASNSELDFRISDGTRTPVSSNVVSIEDGEWHHVAVSADRSGYAWFYVDGILSGGESISARESGNVVGSTFLSIGDWSGNYRWNGLMDELKIYNYARTQKQILEDMNGGGPAVKSPVLHLSFDEGYGETVHDSSIYGNNGTVYVGTGGTQTATSSMWEKNGKVKGAMEFDRTDDHVDVPHDASLVTDDITFSAWFKVDALDTTPQYFISKFNISATNGYTMGIRESNDATNPNEVYVAVTDSSVTTGVFGETVEIDRWYHALATLDNGTLKFYLNGELQGAKSSASIGANTDNFVVGRLYQVYPFGGAVDEVKVWNFALNEDEIKQEYNSGEAFVMGGGDTTANNNGTEVTGASTAYCVPGDTATCSPPVLELKMDEMSGTKANDTSGEGNIGDINGADWKIVGKYGSALEFDGTGDFVQISDQPEISGGHDLTWTAWVNMLDYPGAPSYVYTVFGKADSSESKDYIIRIDSGGNINFYYENGNGNDTPCTGGSCYGNGIVMPGKWEFIAVTYDYSADLISYYVNGIASGTNTLGYKLPDRSDDLYVGMAGYLDEGWKGMIDEARIYNYVRTPAQIAWDYNKGKPIAYWKFDECGGSVIHDESGNGNNGVLNLGATGVTATGTCASSSNSFWYNSRNGNKNSGGNFDGLDDYIDLPDANLYEFAGSDSFAVSSWVKYTGNGGTKPNEAAIIEKWAGGSGPYNFVLRNRRFASVPGQLYCNRYDGTNSAPVRSAQTDLNDNEWHNILCIHDGINKSMTMYVDGVFSNSATYAFTFNNPANIHPWHIGRRGGTYNNQFGGYVDDIRIYNYVLTAEQAKDVYNDGAVSFR